MKYEIIVNQEMFDGKKITSSKMTNSVEMATRDGLNAIKYIPEGKKRYTWVQIPNEYQMKHYVKSFEIRVIEAETGKNIHKIVK